MTENNGAGNAAPQIIEINQVSDLQDRIISLTIEITGNKDASAQIFYRFPRFKVLSFHEYVEVGASVVDPPVPMTGVDGGKKTKNPDDTNYRFKLQRNHEERAARRLVAALEGGNPLFFTATTIEGKVNELTSRMGADIANALIKYMVAAVEWSKASIDDLADRFHGLRSDAGSDTQADGVDNIAVE